MKFELKPLSFGEVLDGAFKVFRDNLVPLLTISVVFQLPIILTSAWIQSAMAGDPTKIPPGAALAWLAMIICMPLHWGTTTAAAVQALTGEPLSVGGAFKRFLKVLGPCIVACLIVGFFGFLLSMLLVFPGVIYFLGRGLFMPVLLVENTSGPDSLKRSKALVGTIRKGRMDRMFGASLVFGILAYALNFGFGMLIPASVKSTFIGAALSLVPSTLLAPLFPIAITLIYFDARIRDEGYDLELRAQQAAAAPAR